MDKWDLFRASLMLPHSLCQTLDSWCQPERSWWEPSWSSFLPLSCLSLLMCLTQITPSLNMPKAKHKWFGMKCWTSAPHRPQEFWLLGHQPYPIAAGPFVPPHSSLMGAPATGSLSLYSTSSEILMLPSPKSFKTIQHLLCICSL